MMNIKTRLKTVVTVGALASLLVALFPASASAYGYYHYTAYDMDINKGDWTSSKAVKRMNWHPWTPNGLGASFQSTLAPQVFGPGKQWHWVFLYDMGGGVFYGIYYHYVNGVEYKDTLRVVRTYNAASSPQTGQANEYAWTPYAHVTHRVYKVGNPIPIAYGHTLMVYRDQKWW